MIIIKTASLKAACLISASADVRYYLNGVRILARPDGTVYVQATDGTVAFDDRMPDVTAYAQVDFIIPLATAKLIAKSKAGVIPILLMENGTYQCEGYIITPIDGKFPDVDRVIPERDVKFTDWVGHYDADLLARCQSAMRIATGKRDGYYRVQNSYTGLMHRETETYPRCAIMQLNIDKAFKDN